MTSYFSYTSEIIEDILDKNIPLNTSTEINLKYLDIVQVKNVMGSYEGN